MSARDELAELIAFETGSAPSGDLVRCSSDGETPVFKLDERLAEAILAAGYRKSNAALEYIAERVKEDGEGEGWTDMSGIIEAISTTVEDLGYDVTAHDYSVEW